MNAVIVHLSDLHFGDPKAVLNRREVSNVLQGLLNRAGPNATLVLSGDITFQGQESGYLEANAAIQEALSAVGLAGQRVVVCPGNHDIVRTTEGGSVFDSFDAWSAGLRNDKCCTFRATSCRLVTCDSIDFLVLNSAYHCDFTYGLVDFAQMDAALRGMDSRPSEGRVRVAVMHHHLVPFAANDTSTTRNAYGVLSRLVKHGFTLLLHGHQHALLNLNVGENLLKICGVGSFRYSTPGFVNSATIHRIDATGNLPTIFFAVSKDSSKYLMEVNPDF